jgi:hypothetical protein
MTSSQKHQEGTKWQEDSCRFIQGPIPSLAATIHFSALAFFSELKFEFRVAASLKYYP